MDNSSYSLIVNSAKINQENIAKARDKICSLFNLQQKQLDKIFSGKPVRLAKNIDHAKAQRYHDAIVKIGVECQIKASSLKQENPATPRPSSATLTLLKLDQQQTTQITKNYLCPECKVQQANKNECEHCSYNLKIYRESMKKKNYIERPGEGYFPERRDQYRRGNATRREMLRMEKISDRRGQEERRKEFGSYSRVF